ncbi:hypothetical protein WKH56_32050 [Priestia sp. SB1]|uniref:hypothetical protein n=1 Tax=Priestia TaxID=2800373 RepID=UPI003174AA1A
MEWTTAITIMGSFGAASTAQIVSHILTNRREKKKYERECLQHLYSPVIFTIIDYIEAEADKASCIEIKEIMESEGEEYNEKEYEEKLLRPDPLFEKIINSVGENLKYAHPALIMVYEEVKAMSASFKDNKEEYINIFDSRIQMCKELLLEFIKISPPGEKEGLNRICFVFLKGLLFGLKYNVISIPKRKCRIRLIYMRSFSFRMNGKHCIGSQKIDQPSSLLSF